MQTRHLTRKQQEIYDFLKKNQGKSTSPPTLDELCLAMGLKSRGSLHKHIQGLIAAGLVESPNRKQRGVRLTREANQSIDQESKIPLVGVIAAGTPIEAFENISYMSIPEPLKSSRPCYILKVKGDSMIDAGILNGDWVVIEQRSYARNGEIVVALINNNEATLKYIEQTPHETVLIPANSALKPLRYPPDQIEIQGVLVGQMRSYSTL